MAPSAVLRVVRCVDFDLDHDDWVDLDVGQWFSLVELGAPRGWQWVGPWMVAIRGSLDRERWQLAGEGMALRGGQWMGLRHVPEPAGGIEPAEQQAGRIGSGAGDEVSCSSTAASLGGFRGSAQQTAIHASPWLLGRRGTGPDVRGLVRIPVPFLPASSDRRNLM